jgi:ribosomal protein L18
MRQRREAPEAESRILAGEDRAESDSRSQSRAPSSRHGLRRSDGLRVFAPKVGPARPPSFTSETRRRRRLEGAPAPRSSRLRHVRVGRPFAPRNSKNPERLFAPRSGRTGFLNGVARRSSRRSSTVARRGLRRSPTRPVRLAIARSNRRSAAQVLDDGSRRESTTQAIDDGSRRGVERRRDRRPISRVERLFAPRSGRTGFLNGAARRSSRRSSTVARRVLDGHRRGQFVSLSLVRTGGPRHRSSTTEFDGGPRHRFSTTEVDDGLRHGSSTTELDRSRTKSRPATDFPRGAPVRTAKRTNWLLERCRASKFSTLVDGRAASPRRTSTRPVRLAIARSNRRSATQVFDDGSRRGAAAQVLDDGPRRESTTLTIDDGSRRESDEDETGDRFPAWTDCSRRETPRTWSACSHREADELAP